MLFYFIVRKHRGQHRELASLFNQLAILGCLLPVSQSNPPPPLPPLHYHQHQHHHHLAHDVTGLILSAINSHQAHYWPTLRHSYPLALGSLSLVLSPPSLWLGRAPVRSQYYPALPERLSCGRAVGGVGGLARGDAAPRGFLARPGAARPDNTRPAGP